MGPLLPLFLLATAIPLPGAAPRGPQEMSSAFDPGGVSITARGRPVSLGLATWGRAGEALPPDAAEPRRDGRRVEYRRGDLTEWYVDDDRGLEQGFTIHCAPGGEGALRLVLAVGAGLSVEVLPGGCDARFRDDSDETVLYYAGLRAWDAAGRELPASLEAVEGGLAIAVEDQGAEYPVHVDPWIATELSKLEFANAETGDGFGSALALSGDTALIGSYGDDNSAGTLAGAAYVFQRDPSSGLWSEYLELHASDGGPGEFFGFAVGLAGDVAIVGKGPNLGGLLIPGMAYVFERDQGGPDQWGEVTELTATPPGNLDHFGEAVAVSGDTILVGAWGDVGKGNNEGAAYVFERDQGGPGAWGQVAKLVASDGGWTDYFGRAVALSGDRAVIGARRNNHSGLTSPGAAYVFERDQGGAGAWGEVVKLVASDPAALDYFGASVAVFGDTILVGSSSDPGPSLAGSAYVFERAPGGAWLEVAKLVAPNPGNAASFGAVAVSEHTALVGLPFGLSEAGAAFLFARDKGGPDNWGFVSQLQASDAQAGDHFGSALALSLDTALVGAAYGEQAYSIEEVNGLAFDPNTNTLYGADIVNDQLVTVDVATGLATPVGPLGFDAVQALAFDPHTDTLYGSDPQSGQLLTIDTQTGAATAVGPTGFTYIRSLAYDPVGDVLYGSNASVLVTLDTTTGNATAVGPFGYTGIWSLAFDPATNTLYGANQSGDDLLTIDTTTGAGTVVGALGSKKVFGLAFDSNAGTLYGSDKETNRLLVIDQTTGAGTAVGPFAYFDEGAAYAFALSFEPETFCTAGTSASGCMATMAAMGQASATASSGFVLSATSVEGDKDGLFFYGANGRQANPWGNGTSFVCVIPPRARGGLMVGVGASGTCQGSFALDLNARWCPTCPKPTHNPGPGALMQAQLWYRDPLNTSNQTSSMSDALEFLVGP